MVTAFDAVGRTVHFFGDLFKCCAVEHFAAKDASIQRMENVLID